MTTASLERGKELQYEINDLKRALSEISRGKLFSIESVSCATHYRSADPFLAYVENELRTTAQTKVLERIEQLENEFKDL